MPKGNWSWDELVSNYQPLYSVKKKKSGKQSSLNYNKDKIKGKIETILKKCLCLVQDNKTVSNIGTIFSFVKVPKYF